MGRLLAVGLCVVAVAVVGVVVGARAEEALSCTDPLQQQPYLTSNAVYLLDNCTASIKLQPDPDAPGSECLTNVSILVRGGNALPHVVLTSPCTTTTTTVAEGDVAGAIGWVYVEVVGVTVTASSSVDAPFLQAGEEGVSRNLMVMIKQSNIMLHMHRDIYNTNDRNAPHNFLHFGYAPFNNVHLRFEDARLQLSTDDILDASWVRFDIALPWRQRLNDGGTLPPSSNLSIEIARCSMSIVINTTATITGVDATNLETGVRASTMVFSIELAEVNYVTLRCADVELFNIIVLPPLSQVLSSFQAPPPRLSLDASAITFTSSSKRPGNVSLVGINVVRCRMHATASESAAVVWAAQLRTFRHVEIAIEDSSIVHALVPYPLPHESAARISSVASITGKDPCATTNIAIRLERVDAVHSVFSGEVPIPSVLTNSTLLNAAADLLRLSTTLVGVVVDIFECAMVADVRNGTAVGLHGFNTSIGSTTSGLLNFDKRFPAANVSVTIRATNASCRMDMFGGFVAFGVIGGSAYALSLVVNATLVSVVMEEVVVYQPEPFVLRASPSGSSEEQLRNGVTLYSLCALFIAADPTAAIVKAMPFFASLRPELTILPVVSLADIRISDSIVWFPSNSDDAVASSSTAIFIASLPWQLTNSTVVLERLGDGGRRPSPLASSPVDVLLCMTGCTVQHSTVRTADVHNVGHLLVAKDGNAVFHSTMVDFAAIDASCCRPSVVHQQPTTRTTSVLATLLALQPFGIVVPPRIVVGNSIVSINASRFSGAFDAVVSSAVVWEGPEAQLVLGCNLWQAAPLDDADIGPVVPRSVVVFPPSVFVVDPTGAAAGGQGGDEQIMVCAGIQSTLTVSTSPSASQDPPVEPAQSFAGAAAAAGANWVVGATSTAAAVVGSTALMALEAQSLVSVGQSVCAPPALRSATSGSRFLLSPFYTLGATGIVLGNVGLLLTLCGAHWLLVSWLRSRSPLALPSPSASTAPVATSGETAPPSSVVLPMLPPPEARAQFPNLSYAAAVFLLQGQLSTAVASAFGGTGATTPVGVVGLVAVAAAWALRWRMLRSTAVRRLVFRPYRRHVLKAFVAPWALPVGRWGPRYVRAAYGRLRGPVRPGAEWMASYPFLCAGAVNALCGIPVPSAWCSGLWVVLCLIPLGVAAMVLWHRPGRAPLSDLLHVAALVSSSTVHLLSGLLASDLLSGDAAGTLLVVAALLGALFTTVRLLHTTVVFVWERNRVDADTHHHGDTLHGDTLTDTFATTPRGAKRLLDLHNDMAFFLLPPSTSRWDRAVAPFSHSTTSAPPTHYSNEDDGDVAPRPPPPQLVCSIHTTPTAGGGVVAPGPSLAPSQSSVGGRWQEDCTAPSFEAVQRRNLETLLREICASAAAGGAQRQQEEHQSRRPTIR